MAALLLRQGARRIGGSVLQRTQAAVTSPAAAEERRQLLPRRMYSTEERIAEFKKILRDRHDKISPTPDGFDRPQFTLGRATRGVASILNNVIKAAVLVTVVSEIDFRRLFGIDH